MKEMFGFVCLDHGRTVSHPDPSQTKSNSHTRRICTYSIPIQWLSPASDLPAHPRLTNCEVWDRCLNPRTSPRSTPSQLRLKTPTTYNFDSLETFLIFQISLALTFHGIVTTDTWRRILR
jgi:hypothetical protein